MAGVLALAAGGGCGGPENGLTPLPSLDRALFAAEAAGIIERRCGAAGCHGEDERPFALYARKQRRLAPTPRFAPAPLMAVEIDANFEATRGFVDADDPLGTTLLRKALGVGGIGGHRGGAVFEAPSDPEVRAIVAWLEGTTW